MNKICAGIVVVFAAFIPSVQASLDLSYVRTINISGLNFNGVGGSAFDETTGNLWLSDSGPSTNDVVEINPQSLFLDVVSSFDASVVPGLGQGPDAMAMHPVTRNLYLFSAFQETDRTGVVTQSGTHIPGFDGPSNVGAAAFNSVGELYAFDQGTGTIGKLDPVNGDILEVTPLIGFSDRIGAADFDPFTGNLIAYSTNTKELLEINPETGQILSFTDVAPFLALPSFPTGISFNATGELLYIASGQNAGGDRLEVLNRVIPEPSMLLLIGIPMVYVCGKRHSRTTQSPR